MKADNIRDVILHYVNYIKLTDPIGLTINHPYFGKGKLIEYNCQTQRVSIKFRNSTAILIIDLEDLLGANSVFEISDKHLEDRFGHLRYASVPNPLFCSPPPNVSPSTAKKIRTTAKKRVAKNAKKQVLRKIPPGAVPLFPA